MEYIIRVKDGQPFEHPIDIENFRLAYPEIDIANLPPGFVEFVRVPCPEPDEGKEILTASSTYQWDGDVIKDFWEIVQQDFFTPPQEN